MKKKYILIVLLFNFILASTFFIQGLKGNVADISSDLANIIPICKKLDNALLYKNDLYLNDINNVKYYTPFYVETLRFIAKCTQYDYVLALNILGFITHLFYGILWFLLFFSLKKDFWLAFVFSIFFRGIIWPPGMELLGISDSWTIMPRTLFIALIPIPYLIFVHFKGNLQYLAALALGILVNFHPISGVGSVIVYTCLLVTYYHFENKLFSKQLLIKGLLFFVLILLGMLPYLWSYLSNVKSDIQVNQVLFNEAFHARIDDVFFDGFLFLKSWFRPVTCFFSVGFIGYFFVDTSENKQNFKSILIAIIVLLAFCNLLPFVENRVNSYFNTNIRMAFQLIRTQKFAMVLMQIATFLFICKLFDKFEISDKIKISCGIVYIVIISFSSAPFINKLPLIGEDITTFIYPNNLKIVPIESKNASALLQMHDYVNKNTNIDDVFYAQDIFFRTATNRAEVLDFHAAGILIEGNQKAYTDLYFTLKEFNGKDESGKLDILRSKKVNYIIVKEKWNIVNLVFQNAEYYIYKL